MKKMMKLFVVCVLFACLMTGCADVAEGLAFGGENREGISVHGVQAIETIAPIEEGYYMVEGRLCEMGKHSLTLETEDGQELYFKLAPETIIYAGDDRELSEGETIKVVFDGTMAESKLEDVSVIAVIVIEK